MIQANELRIGNFLLVNNKAMIVNTIHYEPLIREYSVNVVNKLGDIPAKVIGNVNPISLTEDILLKCGFEERELFEDENPFFILDGVWLGTDSFAKNRFFYNSDIEIKSVHQLQNLYFALTNKELEVKL